MRNGTFEAYATDFGFSTTSTGNVQVSVRLSVPAEKEYIRWYGTFSEKARSYTMAALAAMGWDGVSLDTLDGLGSTPCEIVVADETYEGTTRTKVKYVNPLGGGGPVSKGTLSGDDRRRFMASMKGHVDAWNRERGVTPKPGPKPPATRSDAPPIGDDDIPF